MTPGANMNFYEWVIQKSKSIGMNPLEIFERCKVHPYLLKNWKEGRRPRRYSMIPIIKEISKQSKENYEELLIEGIHTENYK